MKAFDFAKFFHVSQVSKDGKSVVDVMSDMINAYKYERDLSNLCRASRVSKVAFVKEAGEEIFTGYPISVVPYLIFDLAEGDVRKLLKYNEDLDLAWKLGSLHSVAVGLRQLHSINVSHQDLKPSNVLVFKNESKIGDLGRSVCIDLPSPYGDSVFTGDWSYAPPELLYRYYILDWKQRSFATDCYLLGSMIVFYFAGVNMNALIRQNLDDSFSWEFWRGSFDDVKEYLIVAFQKGLEEFSENFSDPYLKEELTTLVKYLCYPIPELRGHLKNLHDQKIRYDLERFISRLALLHNRARYNLIKK